MRIALDRTRCQGYGNCVSAAPDLFDLGDDGIAVVLIEQPSAAQEEAARSAARVCPVAALAILEEARATPEARDVEVVRLPVRDGRETAVLELCAGHPYFDDEGLESHRVLRDSAEPAVVLILEWRSRADADRAIRTPDGQDLLERLKPLLGGAPQIVHCAEA